MKKATFENTVDILVKAYLDDTLKHSECGCAVHNIIRHYDRHATPLWPQVFCTHELLPSGRMVNYFRIDRYFGNIKDQIDLTGYHVDELAKIEFSFEQDRQTKDIFGCLMNVIDTLAQIHKIDLKVKEEAKLLFVK